MSATSSVSDVGDQSRSATAVVRGQMRESIVPAETTSDHIAASPPRMRRSDSASRGGIVLKVGIVVPGTSLPPVELLLHPPLDVEELVLLDVLLLVLELVDELVLELVELLVDELVLELVLELDDTLPLELDVEAAWKDRVAKRLRRSRAIAEIVWNVDDVLDHEVFQMMPSTIALAKAARSPSFPVPKAKRGSWVWRRAY